MNDNSITKEEYLVKEAQQSRREFLERAGKFAAYTTPALLVLMYPGDHAIASGIVEEKGKRKAKRKGGG
jgi:hypothetical protein